MTSNSMICSSCEQGNLFPSVFADDFRHNDSSVRVEGLECYVCDQCGADPVYPDQIRRNQLRIADAKRKADGLLVGSEIRSIREHLGITQQEAAVLFGGGANAFSKYERGDVLQSVAMDRLLKAAAFFPDLFDFLRVEAGVASCPESRISVHEYQTFGSIAVQGVSSQTIADRKKFVVVRDVSWSKAA